MYKTNITKMDVLLFWNLSLGNEFYYSSVFRKLRLPKSSDLTLKIMSHYWYFTTVLCSFSSLIIVFAYSLLKSNHISAVTICKTEKDKLFSYNLTSFRLSLRPFTLWKCPNFWETPKVEAATQKNDSFDYRRLRDLKIRKLFGLLLH